ncbi:MAG: ABC transporter ATP-binding protein [Desulfovibrio sp.]|jgi:iron complex transport system ATP-binding protein|nr:ABC transporter ATP-binding protein [Desulfovibrio sp.]
MLRIVNLHTGYGNKNILHGIDLAGGHGECVALLGRNGSGKTTLLRAISGLLPVSEGEILLDGRSVRDFAPRRRARLCAMVPQREELPAGISSLEMTLLGRYPWLSWLDAYSRGDYEAAHAALTAVDALDLAGREVASLSGGERQRVLLARALAQESPILLLDEPTANLDPARMTELLDLLESRRAAGALVIMALHDCNLAALYATRLVGIKEGCILFDGPVTEMFTEAHLSALYDVPLRVIPHPGFDAPQALHARAAASRPPRK